MRIGMRQRFDSKYIPVTESGCWIWEGKCAGKYPQFRMSTDPSMGSESAHRASWMIYKGSIPQGMMVCHSCDVTQCVNPDHLFLGTAKDNMQDASRKGRMNWKHGDIRNLPVGEAHHGSKLSDELVKIIRASQESGATLARRYSVSNNTISRVRLRTYWRHL